jgi:D-beta-D-heptose 7-phosphate kinase/D-beta-D-heptose 1-phosphate adenosyltransferase
MYEHFKGRFANTRILVIGDLMLDKYIVGDAVRLSPEAPVPIVIIKSERSVPGGAANVAANLATLGCKVTAMGIVGSDNDGTELFNLMQKIGIETSRSLIASGSEEYRETTVKTRVIANDHQIVRYDKEEAKKICERMETLLIGLLTEDLSKGLYDAIIIEDYAKGVITQRIVTEVISACKKAKIPVAIDPCIKNKLEMAGVTIMTPNRQEAFELVGMRDYHEWENPLEDEQLELVANSIFSIFKPVLLLITLGSDGMLLVEGRGDFKHIPTKAIEVFDVSGAGDTVIASLTASYAVCGDAVEASSFSNNAAGVVVGKHGAATITIDEIERHQKETELII